MKVLRVTMHEHNFCSHKFEDSISIEVSLFYSFAFFSSFILCP